jgi:hypothetical protein
LWSGAASAQVRQVPGARLTLAVDKGDDVVLLLLLLLLQAVGGGGVAAVVLQAAHDQLGVVFEVVHLEEKRGKRLKLKTMNNFEVQVFSNLIDPWEKNC